LCSAITPKKVNNYEKFDNEEANMGAAILERPNSFSKSLFIGRKFVKPISDLVIWQTCMKHVRGERIAYGSWFGKAKLWKFTII
jgi:hypothetical protein